MEQIESGFAAPFAQMIAALGEEWSRFSHAMFVKDEGILSLAVIFLAARLIIWAGKSDRKIPQSDFPGHVYYYGEVYRKAVRSIDAGFPRYLLLCGMAVSTLAILEKHFEGNIGVVLKAEFWGIIGAFLGYNILSSVGASSGAMYGGWSAARKNVGIAANVIGWMLAGRVMGAVLGLFSGMLFLSLYVSQKNHIGFISSIVFVSPILILAVIDLQKNFAEVSKANIFSGNVEKRKNVIFICDSYQGRNMPDMVKEMKKPDKTMFDL